MALLRPSVRRAARLRPRERRPPGLALLALALAVPVAGCAPAAAGAPGSASSRSALHGVVPESPAPRARFTLTDTSGARYDLARRTRGRVTLVFWGYTHCDDTCPTTMADIATALRRQPAALRRSVTVVFVTTDPARDTAPVLRHWLDRFDPAFVGLLGTPGQLATAAKRSGVPPPTVRPTRGGGYAVDHFAGVTAYGRDDRVAVVYPTGAVPGDYAADLPSLVKEKSS